MIRALARCTVLLALLFGVAACGQKGPLVLPDKADGQDQKKPDEKKAGETNRAAPTAPEPGR
jgi:predicted small lipoprotein YifL